MLQTCLALRASPEKALWDISSLTVPDWQSYGLCISGPGEGEANCHQPRMMCMIHAIKACLGGEDHAEHQQHDPFGPRSAYEPDIAGLWMARMAPQLQYFPMRLWGLFYKQKDAVVQQSPVSLAN